MGVGRCYSTWHQFYSVLAVVALTNVLTVVEVSARIKVMNALDDETVYIVREKPIIMNIDSPTRGILILAKPVNACGPVAPPPSIINSSLSSTPPPPGNLTLSKSVKDDDDFTWILLVSWSADGEDCSIRTKTERAAEAGYTVVLLQDPAEPDDDDNNDEVEELSPLLAPLTGPGPSTFEYGWSDASVYACTINPVDWAILSKNFTSDEYYLSFEDPNSMNGWFTYFIVGILVIGAVFFTIGLSYVIVQLLVLILIWIRESIVSRIQQMRRDRRRRLPASQLKKIPIQQWNSDMLQDICSICLDNFGVPDRVRILPCSHVFHQVCIDPWLLKSRRKCPNCKRKIVFPDENRESDSSSDDERTPLLMGSSFRESSSSSNASPVATARPAWLTQQRSQSAEPTTTAGQQNPNPAVETESASSRRPPSSQHSPSPAMNSSINASNDAYATSGSPSATSTPQDIKGKVDQLCARVESVGRKIRRKVKTNQASKMENDSSSDLSTVQPLLVSVTVEHHESSDADLPGQDTPSGAESQEPPNLVAVVGAAPATTSQSGSTTTTTNDDEDGGLEVKVVPDCPTSGSPSQNNNSSSNNT